MKPRLFIMIWTLLTALLLTAPALADMEVSVSADCVAVESVVDFTVTGGDGMLQYALMRDGKLLFTHETELAQTAYFPRETGQYVLRVTCGEDSAEAAFTVTDPVSIHMDALTDGLAAGDPLRIHVSAQGGTGVYRYLYTVSDEHGTVLTEEGNSDWVWVCSDAGRYTVSVLAVDTLGMYAEAALQSDVAPGPGISLEACGGALRAHGGQKTWRVHAPGAWTATTQSPFLQLLTPAGQSGDPLSITIAEPCAEGREGLVTIVSGDKRYTFAVRQTPTHGADGEYFLYPADDTVQADGLSHAVWLDATGTRGFTLSGDGPWQCVTQDDFLQAEIADGVLHLTAAPNADPAVRSGTVAIVGQGSTAFVHVYQSPAAVITEAVNAQPLPELKRADEGFIIYSQSSGQWKDAPYGQSTLEHSGCAIFALAHALQCLGIEGDETLPTALAPRYAFSLREGGTINSTLVGNAGDDFGFSTRYELYENLSTIRSKTRDGAVWSFAVVQGHIAMVAEMSEDGSMFRVIDSAPSATWERIKNARLYRRETDGSFTPISSLTELEGIRYYIETGAFGGATYWLEADYIARRGVRLIQP